MHVVTSIKPPVSSHLHPLGGKCVATGGEEWQRRWFDAGTGGFIKTSAGLVQPNVLGWIMSLKMKREEREEGALRCGVWTRAWSVGVVGAITAQHGKSPQEQTLCV